MRLELAEEDYACLRVWNSPTKGDVNMIIPNGDPLLYYKEWDLSQGPMPTTLYVEGTVTSSPRFDKVSLSYNSNGGPVHTDTVNFTVVEVDLDMADVLDSEETCKGGYVALNVDDDNNNGTADKDESGPVTNENDLVKITMRDVLPIALTGNVTLRAIPAAAVGTKIKIWESQTKGGSPITLPATYATPTDLPDDLWVEGIGVSSSARNITLAMEYSIAGKTFEDKIKITVFDVASVEPSGTTKVMISTMHDDTYPSNYQSQDRKIKIAATITPAVADATVYFRIQDPDPDDGSPYDSASNDDNRGTPKLGNLSASSATTNSNGKAETVLTVTDRYAGDNYIVEASQLSDFGTVGQSGILVAWKRIYVEEDTMYRTGSDLAVDFTADGDTDFDTITVEDASIFSVGNWITIFDADNPTGETRAIISISGNDITIADLVHSYNAGYESGDKGAAVGRQADEFYDADVTGRTGNAFGVAADGSDGGCFVEIKILLDGGNKVPYKHMLPTGVGRAEFCDMWFKNKGKLNYIWVCGARCQVGVADGRSGKSWSDENYSYIWVGAIEVASSDPTTLNKEITAHEIGHQFDLTQVDENHPDVWCHEGSGTDECLMDYDADFLDSYSEFCYDNPNHIMYIRDKEDGI